MKRLRSAIRGAKSGVMWKETRVRHDNSLPALIDQVVPMAIVFGYPTMASVRVLTPLGMTAHPPEVLFELSSQIYSAILPLISYADHRLHHGVVDDYGWAHRCEVSRHGCGGLNRNVKLGHREESQTLGGGSL